MTQGLRPYLLLTLLWALVALPGLTSMPVMDRDEARFVQATRQMVESDDYVVVRFQDDLRAKKPVGIYWLQAAAVQAFSHPAKTDVWPYRLPSALGVLLAVLMTFRLGAALFDRRIALVGAGLLATCLMAAVESHLAKTDGLLLGLSTTVMACFGMVYLQGKGGARAPSWAPLVMWIALGCAILVKGPVTAMILILAAIALAIGDRTVVFLQGLRPVMGLVVTAAIVAPWLSAVSSATDGAFVQKAISEDLIPKLLGAQESHGGFPGQYLVLMVLTFFPASLFVVPALLRGWRERALPGARYLLAWAVPGWIVFELIPTKLPHYTLPFYPALALLVAAALFAVRDGTYDRLAALPAKLWYGLWSLIALALAGGFVALPMIYGAGFSLWSLPAAGAALAVVLYGWVQIVQRHFINAAAGAMLGAVVIYGSVFGGLMGSLDQLWVSQRVAAQIDKIAPLDGVVAAGYHEPSLVFLTGTKTNLTDGAGAAAFLAAHDGVAVVAQAAQAQFEQTLAAEGMDEKVIRVATIDGFNYSRGKPVSIGLYARLRKEP
jgi:4-amino-4-deoxy-L-arabinose transferase-like glycosyltransferase